MKVAPWFGLAAVSLLSSCTSVDAAFTDRQPPLVNVAGRYAEGEVVFNDRDSGHCVLCHQLANSSAPFQGNIGPALDGVGERLDADQIRYRLVDNRRLNPGSLMPAYFSTSNLQQVATGFKGKTVLSAIQIEDLVAYLAAQQTPET